MAIRINITSEGLGVVIHLAGRLSGGAGIELSKACGPIEGAIVLDLSKLLFADDAGIEVIRALDARGAKIRGASPFVQLLLDDTHGQETDGKG